MDGEGGGPGTKFLSEPQNGRPAVTAWCSDHKWTLHNKQAHSYAYCRKEMLSLGVGGETELRKVILGYKHTQA